MENPPIKNGIYMGGVLVGLALLAYFINSSWIFHPGLRLAGGLLVPLYFIYKSIIEQRLEEQGMISFGEAIKTGFIAFLVGTLMYSIFQYLLMNFIDPGMQEVAKEATLSFAATIENIVGTETNEIVDPMREQLEMRNIYGFGFTALNWMQGLIGGFILAAIFAAVLKRSS